MNPGRLLSTGIAGACLAVTVTASEWAIPGDTVTQAMKSAGITELSMAMIRDEVVVDSARLGNPSLRSFQVGFLSRLPLLIHVFQLVDSNRISLKKPANDYLKKWKIPAFAPGSKPVLVEDLLTAQSGFADYKLTPLLATAALPENPSLLAGKKPVKPPKAGVDRSAINEMILQQIIEDVEGKPFSEVVTKAVLAPLGLKDTFYGKPDASKKALVVKGNLPSFFYPNLAAEGMWSSAPDIAKMLVELMRSARAESKLLKQSSAKLLFKEVKNGATFGLNRLGTGDGSTIQLGGQTSGFSCKFRIMPEDGLGAVVLTNHDMGWRAIDALLDESFVRLSTLKAGESAPSFEPYHASGEYAGEEICPVCEYMFLPMTFVWAQNDTDENLIASAKVLQAQVVAAGTTKTKAFIVLSNLDNNLVAAKAKALALANKAQTPNVAFVVIKDAFAGTLRSYRIDRRSKNVVYLVKGRVVKEVMKDFTCDPAGAEVLAGSVQRLVKLP